MLFPWGFEARDFTSLNIGSSKEQVLGTLFPILACVTQAISVGERIAGQKSVRNVSLLTFLIGFGQIWVGSASKKESSLFSAPHPSSVSSTLHSSRSEHLSVLSEPRSAHVLTFTHILSLA